MSWPAALGALRAFRRVEGGDVAVIHVAAGGTGQAAVRLAKHYGATVIATASRSKLDTVVEMVQTTCRT